MKIRMFSDNDLAGCVQLLISVFNEEPWNDNWTVEKAELYLMDFVNNPGFMGYIAENSTGVIGFLFGYRKRWWSADEFHVNEFCVKISEQRRGIGKELMKILEDDLVKQKIMNIVLLTNKGVPAMEFYERNGFTAVERIVFLAKSLEDQIDR
ncbi:GNAT family N-acetyltransferase [Paenibacillus yanchengensis]|uniref:GNAT family N-acetyltransferase n=1 Tax=Paenibacillus yanchengensis TaxID=2035833 RepID=A0ABW4YJ91_9BACL